jgi:hypothetical protein
VRNKKAANHCEHFYPEGWPPVAIKETLVAFSTPGTSLESLCLSVVQYKLFISLLTSFSCVKRGGAEQRHVRTSRNCCLGVVHEEEGLMRANKGVVVLERY